MYMKEWKLFPKMADVGNEDWAYHSSSHRAPCVTTVYKLPTPTSDLLTHAYCQNNRNVSGLSDNRNVFRALPGRSENKCKLASVRKEYNRTISSELQCFFTQWYT